MLVRETKKDLLFDERVGGSLCIVGVGLKAGRAVRCRGLGGDPTEASILVLKRRGHRALRAQEAGLSLGHALCAREAAEQLGGRVLNSSGVVGTGARQRADVIRGN